MEYVTAWNDAALTSIREENHPPPFAAQFLAALHLAIFESANSSTGRYASRMETPVDPSSASLQRLKTTAAAWYIFKRFASPGPLARAQQWLDEDIANAEGNEAGKLSAIDKGYQLGEALLRKHLEVDGKTPPGPFKSSAPGVWVPTPPTFAPYLLPGWGKIPPWLYAQAPAGPPALDSAGYAKALDEVQRLGAKNSLERSAQQTETAFFWADGNGTATPPGHWNLILSDHLRSCSNDLVALARIFAVLNMAIADSCIAAWDAKWNFYVWRPVTALGPNWEPLLVTPPFPSYVSGHASTSGAAAEILQAFFNNKLNAIKVQSETLPGVERRYSDFFTMAEEASRSRIYGGLHFNFDADDGLAIGRGIGQFHGLNSLAPRDPTDSQARDGLSCLSP